MKLLIATLILAGTAACGPLSSPPTHPEDLSLRRDEGHIAACQAELAARPSCVPPGVGTGPGQRWPAPHEIEDCTERQSHERGPACAAATDAEGLAAITRHNEARRRELEQQSERRLAIANARRERMQPTVDAAGARWSACVKAAALRLALSPEPAATVVSAAYGACSPEEEQYETIYKTAEGRDFTAILERVKEQLAPQYLALVLAARQASEDRRPAPDRKPATAHEI